uniref:39S ribosomal protein L28, mitochondrial n=1 Tax=Neobodo designis TaxID=312471 RepID=A0A7S1M314_NEODS
MQRQYRCVVASSRGAAALPVAATASRRPQSEFHINMPTATAPHGNPRGIVNQAVSQGLPPYAAWLQNITSKQRYEVSGVDPYGFLPRKDGEVDEIWLDERIRMRTFATTDQQKMRKKLIYPWMKVGVWYSETLRHWVQVPHVEAAQYEIEKDGGIDNFILKRPSHALNSRYAERLRRHLLVRRKEIEKNAVLKSHAQKLAGVIVEELKAAATAEELRAVCDKYGLAPEILKAIASQTRIPAAKAVQYVERS